LLQPTNNYKKMETNENKTKEPGGWLNMILPVAVSVTISLLCLAFIMGTKDKQTDVNTEEIKLVKEKDREQDQVLLEQTTIQKQTVVILKSISKEVDENTGDIKTLEVEQKEHLRNHP